MEYDQNSNTIVGILNNVLKNINEDISLLRADFKKLNDIVIVLSVKVEETKSIKHEIKQISSKVEVISNRIFELEKAKEKLEFLITQVDQNHTSKDALTDLTLEQKLDAINARIKGYDDKMPILWKIIIGIIIVLGIILYVTNFYGAALSIVSKFIAIF